MKAIRYTLYAIAGLVALLIVGVAIFTLTFDPNRYKGEIERAVKERTGRTLKVGNLAVALLPSLGARVSGITLAERGSDRPFVALDSAHASVALLPLLRGQVIVNGIRISGLKVSVVKEKDGRFNFSDLLEAKPGEAAKAPPSPKVDGKAARAEKGALGFDVASFGIDRSSVSYIDKTSGQELALSDLALTTGRIAALADGKLAFKGTAKGRNPDLDLKLDIHGGYHLDLEKENVALDLSTKLDESNILAKLGLTKFSPPSYTFDLAIDRLNLDRYSSPGGKAAATTPRVPRGKAVAPSATQKEEDTPVDLSALKDLNASGRLQVDALQVKGLKLANVKAEVRAANGRLDVAPHSASLYEGSVSGAITALAEGRVAAKETLSGIAVGPLLRDLAQKDLLEGRGHLSLDVNAAGKTVNAMKKSLAGSARVQLKDGAIKGINLAEALRKANAALGSQESRAEASKEQKTDFSEMTASFAIRNGVAHSEDLDAKSPLFRIGGRGDIDVANSTIDYVAKATVVATTQGQGGADLAELSGLTVPVHLVGPFDAIKYQVDYSAVASQFAKSKAGERVREKLKGLLGR